MRHFKMKLCMVAAVTGLFMGCTSHRFIPTGTASSQLPPQAAECGAKVLLKMPADGRYQEIGLCMAQAPGGGIISDNTPDAVFELQRCACLHGGNAIVLSTTSEGGVFAGAFGYSQQMAKAQGVAIRVE